MRIAIQNMEAKRGPVLVGEFPYVFQEGLQANVGMHLFHVHVVLGIVVHHTQGFFFPIFLQDGVYGNPFYPSFKGTFVLVLAYFVINGHKTVM